MSKLIRVGKVRGGDNAAVTARDDGLTATDKKDTVEQNFSGVGLYSTRLIGRRGVLDGVSIRLR